MPKRPTSPADLPESVPIFPLSGALLLPFAHRPLNIFEPRYVQMIDDALAGNRLVGLIQPQDPAAAMFDANDYDFSQIPGFIAAAKASSGITDPDSVIVIVDRAGAADASGSIPVRAMVLLDSAYEDANVIFDLATGEPMG